jgi:uncharacterized protein YggU (UPF0235/DUF167 family)
VSALEWLVILELVVLAILGVMQAAAAVIASENPYDPLAVFCRTFWREFLHPPESIPINPARYIQPEGGGSVGRGGLSHPEPTEDDEFYGRSPKPAGGGGKKVDLPILVEPSAAADEVIGRDGDGIRIRVTGEAGDSRSNKALIEMVATAVGVKPYQVTLTKGHYQTRKAVQIQGLSEDQLQDRLAELPEAE